MRTLVLVTAICSFAVAAPAQAFFQFQTPSHNIACVGDTALDPRAPVLAYGKSKVYAKSFRCTSRTSGLRCQNKAGHGFFLSRAKQSIF